MDICPQSDVSAVSCVVYETVADFVFLGSKIIADNDIAMKLRHLLLGRKVMTNLDSILKSRDITLPTKKSVS